jgi:hypothetical protein
MPKRGKRNNEAEVLAMVEKGVDNMDGFAVVLAFGRLLLRAPRQHPVVLTICLILLIVTLSLSVSYDGGTWHVVYHPLLS